MTEDILRSFYFQKSSTCDNSTKQLFSSVESFIYFPLVKQSLTVRFIEALTIFSFQDVSGQVVLITGGGGGVGRLLALNFARLNSRVVIWDVNREGEFNDDAKLTKRRFQRREIF